MIRTLVMTLMVTACSDQPHHPARAASPHDPIAVDGTAVDRAPTTVCASLFDDKNQLTDNHVRENCVFNEPVAFDDLVAEHTSLRFENVHFTKAVSGRRSKLRSLELVGCTFDNGLDLQGSDFDGRLSVRHRQRSMDEQGRYAHDGKRCSTPSDAWLNHGASVVKGPESSTLGLGSITAKEVDLSGVDVKGQLVLKDARVTGNVFLSSARITNANLQALQVANLAADGVVVQNNLRLFSVSAHHVDLACSTLGTLNGIDMRASGIIQLTDAIVGGQHREWDVGASVDLAGVQYDYLTLSASTFFGSVTLHNARGRSLDLDGATFKNGLAISRAEAMRLEVTGIDLQTQMDDNSLRCNGEVARLCVDGASIEEVVDRNGLDASLGFLRHAPYDGRLYATMEERFRSAGRIGLANAVYLEGRDRQAELTPAPIRWVFKALVMVGYGRKATGWYVLAFAIEFLIGGFVFLMISRRDNGAKGQDITAFGASEPATSIIRPSWGPMLFALDTLLPAFIDLHYRERYIGFFYQQPRSRLILAAYQLVGWATVSLILISLTRYFS